MDDVKYSMKTGSQCTDHEKLEETRHISVPYRPTADKHTATYNTGIHIISQLITSNS